MEIQELIGRYLRSVVHLNLLGEKTIWLDCDAIQADGSTYIAAITGAFVAMTLLLLISTLKKIQMFPVRDFLRATRISAGILENNGSF